MLPGKQIHLHKNKLIFNTGGTIIHIRVNFTNKCVVFADKCVNVFQHFFKNMSKWVYNFRQMVCTLCKAIYHLHKLNDICNKKRSNYK
jgi:hypothetical protein